MRECFAKPFVWRGRFDRPLLAVFLAIQGLVLLNAVLHYPGIGYDAGEHLKYIETLAAGRLPGPADTYEFFAAPLPYVLPALLRRLGLSIGMAGKAAQLLNVAWSVLLTGSLVAICRWARPADRWFPLSCLFLLGLLPVYYKTMAYVRGEPLAAALGVASVYLALRTFAEQGAGARRFVGLGVLLGLLLLAKQWGVFVLGAIVLLALTALILDAGSRRRHARGLLVVLGVAALTGGWYYGSLTQRFGTPAAFNESPASRPIVSERHYEALAFGVGGLLRDPVRETELPPVLLFYADTWGDYWAYWVVHARDAARVEHVVPSGENLASQRGVRLLTNRSSVGPYLGRVNAASILPTLVLLAGLVFGLAGLRKVMREGLADREAAACAISGAVIALSAGGYAVMLLRYADLDVKASYMLHAFPFAAILGGVALGRLRVRRPRIHLAAVAGLVLVLLHNLPVLVTRYIGR